jgi:hypothetical protein
VSRCKNAEIVLSRTVQHSIPNLVETEHGFENDELGVYLGCTANPGDRFIALDLQIFHKPSKVLVDKRIREMQ